VANTNQTKFAKHFYVVKVKYHPESLSSFERGTCRHMGVCVRLDA